MNLNPDKTLQINFLGEILLGDEPVGDLKTGTKLLSSLTMDGHVCLAHYEGERVLVEAYTFPLVVLDVEKGENGLLLKYNYGLTETISHSQKLFLNDWSQICSFNQNHVPLVFSEHAHAKFYSEIADSDSYENYTIEGREYEFEDWYIENNDTRDDKMWSKRYQNKDTPWDLNTYHPCLDWTLPRLKLSKSKILVPGCGSGHDAAKLHALGHKVTGLDFSKEAIQEAREANKDVPFLHSDVFSHARTHPEHYDLIFEHTLFCAIETSLRSKLVKTWSELLKEKGHLLGTFIVCNKRKGPPFGVTEWELEELLSPYFKIEYWGRLRGKESARPGKELYIYARKK